MKICISAGHGRGSRKPGQIDSGAVGSGTTEAAEVLQLSRNIERDLDILRVKNILRDGGYFANADDDAARAGCTHFLEIHLNSGGGTGTEVLINALAPNGSRRFAERVDVGVSRALGLRDRGVKIDSRGLAVLRPHPGMKACLLEVVFVDRPADVKRLHQRWDGVELAIVNAILAEAGRRPAKKLPRKWSWVVRKLRG